MLIDLDNGATSLWVELGAGLAVDDLPRALQGVLLDLAPVILSGSSAAAARALVALADDTGVDLHAGTNFGADPLADDLVEVATLAREHGVLGVVASGLAVHEQGASDAQELGVAIAAGVAALRALTGGRLHGRRGRGRHRVPARRHRRAVPLDRQAARRSPAVGASAGAERGRRWSRCASTRSPRARR